MTAKNEKNSIKETSSIEFDKTYLEMNSCCLNMFLYIFRQQQCVYVREREKTHCFIYVLFVCYTRCCIPCHQWLQPLRLQCHLDCINERQPFFLIPFYYTRPADVVALIILLLVSEQEKYLCIFKKKQDFFSFQNIFSNFQIKTYHARTGVI